MQGRSILIVLALGLAGCTSAPEGGAPAGPEGPVAPEPGDAPGTSAAAPPDASVPGQPGENATKRFARTFPLAVKEGLHGSIGVGENGGNCVGLQDGIKILRGNATLSWESTAGLPEELALRFRLQPDSRTVAEATGPSPLTIDFAEVANTTASDGWPWPYLFSVHAASEPEAVVDVELTIMLEHEGADIVDIATDAACS